MSSTTSKTTEPLDALLQKLKIDNWDLLLVGDGSGSTWDRECGWGCVSIEKSTLERRVWHGALSHGTVNVAEAMAYLQPLCWYVDRELKVRKHGGKIGVRHVHIVTDSGYLQSSGDKPARDLLSSNNGPIWNVFRQFSSHGILLHWHWVRRETVELNEFADHLSKAARLNIKGKELPERAIEPFRPARDSVYDFNPWE